MVRMKAKSLSKTNPFLTSQADSDPRVITSVSSSTAVETGEEIKAVKAKLIRHRATKHSAVKLA